MPRRVPDSNGCERLCRPLPNHSANAPGLRTVSHFYTDCGTLRPFTAVPDRRLLCDETPANQQFLASNLSIAASTATGEALSPPVRRNHPCNDLHRGGRSRPHSDAGRVRAPGSETLVSPAIDADRLVSRRSVRAFARVGRLAYPQRPVCERVSVHVGHLVERRRVCGVVGVGVSAGAVVPGVPGVAARRWVVARVAEHIQGVRTALVPENLLDARVGHARSLTNGPVRLSFRDSVTDGGAPLGIGSAPLGGCPSDAGQGVHLLAEAEQGGVVCLLTGVAERHPLADDGFALGLHLGGLAAEDGACVADGFSACHGSVHMARIVANGGVVKW